MIGGSLGLIARRVLIVDAYLGDVRKQLDGQTVLVEYVEYQDLATSMDAGDLPYE